jgi:hypothetical protein
MTALKQPLAEKVAQQKRSLGLCSAMKKSNKGKQSQSMNLAIETTSRLHVVGIVLEFVGTIDNY